MGPRKSSTLAEQMSAPPVKEQSRSQEPLLQLVEAVVVKASRLFVKAHL